MTRRHVLLWLGALGSSVLPFSPVVLLVQGLEASQILGGSTSESFGS